MNIDRVVEQTMRQNQVPTEIMLSPRTYCEYEEELCTKKVPKQKLGVSSIRIMFLVTTSYRIPVTATGDVPYGQVWCKWREPQEGEQIHVP